VEALLGAVLEEASLDFADKCESGGGDGEGDVKGSEEAIDFGIVKSGVDLELDGASACDLLAHVTSFSGSRRRTLIMITAYTHHHVMSRLFSTFPFSLITGKPYVPQNKPNMSTFVPQSQVATFAAGCFWGVEHIFLKQWPIKENKGILKSAVGYTGGRADSTNPTYRDVCLGTTSHAEAVRIEFDPSKVTYDELVGLSAYCVGRHNCLSDVLFLTEYFYRTHDPTTLNSQGADRGTRAFGRFPSRSSLANPTYMQSTAPPYSSTPQSKSRLPTV
jgi:Peptide methionine sulfoxide reductase